ncbi:MAG: sensor histidine kinase, partial [Prolixibacteraceae bacterium]
LRQFGILFTDITKRMQTEKKFRGKVKELKASEEKFRTLSNNISQLAWMADNKGRILWINKRWIDYTGKPPQEIEGFGWKKIIHPEHLERLGKTVSLAIKNEEPWDEFVPLQNQAGSYRWFLFRVLPVRDELANSIRWFGTATDVTKQREIEDLQKKDKELVENLLYIAAHDLKGPVANMQGFFELMDKMEPEQKLTILEHFRKLADQLDKTINGITDILRVRDTDKSSATRVDFDGIINQVLQEYKDKLPPSAVKLDVKNKPTIRYIEPLLYSVIKNLISNSIKYSRDNVPLHIGISTQKDGDYILLSVSDNGIGIDLKKFGKRIFSPFQRFVIDKATGTGIGLYLVKSIIEKNGGYVRVESTPGKGTTFYCYLREY